MSKKLSLIEAYNQTKYQLVGHSKRDLAVLKEALEAFESDLESDNYGTGKIIDEFQEKMAEFLGKEAAVFFPSGTMAQQIALRIWCDKKGLKRVAYHPLSHLEIREEDGLKELHQIESILLADKDSVIQLADVVNIDKEISCLLLELPQREIGGQLPDYETLEAISNYCREKNIKIHLDGARLYEILPYYRKSAPEISRLFDSVYVSMYKGIGGIAGAILAGDHDFIKDSIVWKRRQGGDLISLYPYIISADYYFNKRAHKMSQYYDEAVELARYFNQCEGIETKPLVPVSNMFHVHVQVSEEKLETILVELYEETGVGLTTRITEAEGNKCFFEMSIGDRYSLVPTNEVENVIKVLDRRLKEVGPEA
ncbi:threonine aldolase family protein [Anaerobacillus isosaccharinicus]|uniref:Threonine aldolase family protein n=1 Tax=Anaerobacillus isosaccharinicus TaxID=1532552 RepID=A0A7S7L6P2_9BACI|nr:aminotransferase class I/II-fold pyridoxal phosphate-dependent enzyme [Anaerobacillus isosaccharinicus]MBA5586307.1 aminotransferase class I/II-fold pyridoxal phosphate-dependent enzyme [Anaerobacillus isosaccharinicus]QOY35443.1 aminotransferase class I/II-fold pyridoxal phosphate-dependent enzyme [Anaerobacillus isosaccharinicus]